MTKPTTYDELRGAVLVIAQEVAKWYQDNPYPESSVYDDISLQNYDEARVDMHIDTVDAITQLAKGIA